MTNEQATEKIIGIAVQNLNTMPAKEQIERLTAAVERGEKVDWFEEGGKASEESLRQRLQDQKDANEE